MAIVLSIWLVSSARGETLTSSDPESLTDLLPQPVLNWVKEAKWPLVLGEMQTEVSWESEFNEASARNKDRFDVDGDGGLVERSTGVRPPHVYGFPFPDIDTADPSAGVKVMWNATQATFKVGRLRTPFALYWIGQEGFERLVKGQAFGLAFDYQPTFLPDPDRTETRDLFEALSPASVNGVATLTWRYMDNRPDSVWGYLPATRRVRQLTAANRSDPSYGSDLTQDDGFLWLGKNQSFRWKLIEAKDVLVMTVDPDLVRLVPGPMGTAGQEWRSPASFPGVTFGWEAASWTAAPWLPTNVVWVRRPVWVVEGQPKDPYYAYGRQVFYVDRSTFKIYYKVVYTPAGEYWKTVLNDLDLAVTGDGRRYPVIAALIAVDDRAHHASYTKGNAPDHIVEYNSVRVQPDLFTMSGLLRLGK